MSSERLSLLLMQRNALTLRLADANAQDHHAPSPPNMDSAHRKQSTSAGMVALLVYVLSGYDIEPTIVALRKTKRFEFQTDDERKRLIEQSFLNTNIAELSSLIETEPPGASLQTARCIIHEWGVVKWCRDLNFACGIPVSTHELLKRIQLDWDGLPRAVFATTRSGKPSRCARTWAARFRKRWGGRIGSVRIVDAMPLQEMSDKVRTRGVDHARAC